MYVYNPALGMHTFDVTADAVRPGHRVLLANAVATVTMVNNAGAYTVLRTTDKRTYRFRKAHVMQRVTRALSG